MNTRRLSGASVTVSVTSRDSGLANNDRKPNSPHRPV